MADHVQAKYLRKKPFLPIPQAPRYEMNPDGLIRNIKTGKIVKWQRHYGRAKQTTLHLGNGKYVCVTRPNLLWLLFGIVTAKTASIPVKATRGTRYMRFDSINQCAKFLASVTSRTLPACSYRLTRRDKTVDGWQIKYGY